MTTAWRDNGGAVSYVPESSYVPYAVKGEEQVVDFRDIAVPSAPGWHCLFLAGFRLPPDMSEEDFVEFLRGIDERKN